MTLAAWAIDAARRGSGSTGALDAGTRLRATEEFGTMSNGFETGRTTPAARAGTEDGTATGGGFDGALEMAGAGRGLPELPAPAPALMA